MKYRIMRSIIRLLVRLIARVELRDMENIPAGNVIVVGNHLGRLDTALFFCVIEREDIIMPIAGKYKYHPLFGLMGWAADGIWLSREGDDSGALRQILARMQQGGLLILAPEGTRSRTEALQPARLGAAYLASKSGFPVVPTAVTGTEDRLVKENLRHVRRSPILVRAGKPFVVDVPKGRGREEAYRAATDEIMCQIAALLPAKYRGVYAGHPRLAEILRENGQPNQERGAQDGRSSAG
jgi:1-acyl-sn-glycerol-3-phosphate acyltransferase